MTVAQELEARMWLIADPKTKWVQGPPMNPGECCLAYDYGELYSEPGLSWPVWSFLKDLTKADNVVGGPAQHNDLVARDRDDVIQFLDEAVELAKWLGI